MDKSTAHTDARVAAIRVPAMNASLALLVASGPTGPFATVSLYGTAKPAPGDPPGAAPIVTINLTETAGVVDTDLFQIKLDAPVEGQIDGADPTLGTIPLWGRVSDPAGAWWGDVTVTVEGSGGEIQVEQTGIENSVPVARLYNGAFCRLTSMTFQG